MDSTRAQTLSLRRRPSRHRTRFVGALVLAPAVAVLAPTVAHAELYRRDPLRLEPRLEFAFPVWDADASFDELQPTALFGLGLGLYVVRDLRVGFVVRAPITDPEADYVESLVEVAWSWVDEPRLSQAPALRAGFSAALGWHWLELHGSDFIVNSTGLTVVAQAEIGLVLFEDFALSATLSTALGTESNRAIDDFAPSLRLGLALSTLF